MKISADFYTPDEAAYAAGVIKALMPDVTDVSISGRPKNNYGRKNAFTSAAGDQTAFSAAGYGVNGINGVSPIYAETANSYYSAADTEKRGNYTVNVVCTKDREREVSGILVNRGGHNVTEM